MNWFLLPLYILISVLSIIPFIPLFTFLSDLSPVGIKILEENVYLFLVLLNDRRRFKW